MRLAILLLLSVAHLSEGSDHGLAATADGDSTSRPVVAAAGRLLDMAGLLFGEEPVPPEAVEEFLKSLDSLPPAGERDHLAGLSSSGGSDRQRMFDAAGRGFDGVIAAGMPRDTVRSSFRDLFYAFHNLYIGELENVPLRDSGTTMVLCSASITCDCTRRLSDSYTRQIAQAKAMLEDFPAVLVLDCAENPAWMDRFRVGTLPAVIILDRKNIESARFEEKEFILPGMVEHLQSGGPGNLK